MTDRLLVTRRVLIRDMGKAGWALMVLGTAACSGDTTGASTSSSVGGGSSTSPGVDATTSSTIDGGSTTTAAATGYEWQRVNLDFVSAYVLYRSGEATIVDTGIGGSEGAIEAALGEAGLGWGDVSGLVITHLHPDHQGSVAAVIAATSESLPWFAGAADIAGIDAPTEGQAVEDGETVGTGLEIIETPGHTAGHISVLDPTAGILVAGDALNGANGGVAGPNADFSDDMGLANASVSKLAGFDYEVAVFGHGEPVTAGASGLVAELAESIG
jgi:glyoxylase-like metal-dependent hydrolase (beta-lactamase superfamily II)